MVSSTIWAALATPNPASGSIPFVDTDNASITTDVLNLSYSKATQDITITNGMVPDSFVNTGASPVTLNHTAGVVALAAGTSTVVVNNNLIRVGALVFLQRRTNDATAISLAVTIGTSSFTITSNANATGAVNINFLLVNTNPQLS